MAPHCRFKDSTVVLDLRNTHKIVVDRYCLLVYGSNCIFVFDWNLSLFYWVLYIIFIIKHGLYQVYY